MRPLYKMLFLSFCSGYKISYFNNLQTEWEALKSKIVKGRQVVISAEEFCTKTDPYVLIGHNSTGYKIVLSKTLSAEYEKHLPNMMERFTCADCGASFSHINMLSNHLHLVHMNKVSL